MKPNALDISPYLAPRVMKELTAKADHDYAIITSNRHKATTDLDPETLDNILLRLNDEYAFVGYRLDEPEGITGFAESHLVTLDGWIMWLTVLYMQEGEFTAYLMHSGIPAVRFIEDFIAKYPSDNWVMVKNDQLL